MNACVDRTASRIPVTGKPARVRRDPSALERISAGIVSLFEQVSLWRARAYQRKQLSELSDHMLRDIGVSRADVEHEAGKPFWRP